MRAWLTPIAGMLCKPTFPRVALPVLCIALAVAVLGNATSVGAQEADPVSNEMTLDRAEIVIGDQVNITVRMHVRRDGVDVPVRNAAVQFLINGEHLRQARTDLHGFATVRTSRDLEAGLHTVTADFQGSSRLAPTQVSTEMRVLPWTLTIETVPAISGAAFSVDGVTFVSGPDGIASLDIQRAGKHQVNFEHVTLPDPSMRAEFDRWGVTWFSSSYEFKAPAKGRLQAAFQISTLVAFSFVDPLGYPVPGERVSSITIRSNSGTVYTFDSMEPQWVTSQLLARRSSGVIASAGVTYAVQSVVVDGANVVNEAQQRFEPRPDAEWQIDTLLFSAEFVARDALFGFPVGTGFQLVYPDGQISEIPADRQAHARARSLARGLYEVGVIRPPGIAPPAPVAVVRDQQIELKVISYFDIAVVGIIGVAVALGLLVVGRPQTFRKLHHRTRLSSRWPATLSLWTMAMALLIMTSAALLAGSYHLTVGSVSANSAHPPDRTARALPASGSVAQREAAPANENEDGEVDQEESVPVDERNEGSTEPPPTQSLPVQGTVIDVDRVFLEFWEQHGGADVFGEPLSQVYFDSSTGYLSQVFEYAVLEHHPARTRIEDQVQLRHLGITDARRRELLDSTETVFALQSQSEQSTGACVYFPATGHSACGPFLEHWQRSGLDLGDSGVSYRESLARNGYPISESFIDPESGWTVQYFQRVRLEYQPPAPESMRMAPLGERFINPGT